jgi:hypothetical protein
MHLTGRLEGSTRRPKLLPKNGCCLLLLPLSCSSRAHRLTPALTAAQGG